MYKIGDFANLFQVSIKTIRYYETIGLLIPKYVNLYTGYRYYDENNIYTMQNIISLKNLGFSLEEIKFFKQESIRQKIANYEKEILNLQSKIKSLKQFDLPTKGNDLKMLFVNDELALGKWVLRGIAKTREDADANNFGEDDYNIQELYLLPQGEPYWVISWTKDTIFIAGKPNHYEIVGNKLYLTVTDEIDLSNSKVAVYENVDHHHYSIDDIRQKDNTQIEFIADERVVGTWQTVDYINNAAFFNPQKLQSSKDMLLLDKLVFDDKGNVSVSYTSGKTFTTKYTQNYLINLILPDTLCHYTYQEIFGQKYIIVEWKSGDYVFGKVINGYYVLGKQE